MRLGGNVFYEGRDPVEYARLHVQKGYGAALCPDWIRLDEKETLRSFQNVMKEYDIRIAEVGAWCNPLHPDKKVAEENIQYMINRLQLAEELEACTCVNILGTKHTGNWFGADKDCYSEAFFEEAVTVSQRIIDAVKPQKTKMSFEMMPYCFLDSPQEYLRFLEAVDRVEAGVHLDICNTMNHPRRFYSNSEFIKETFALLKDKIVTIHLKDIALRTDELTVVFEEVLLGTGGIDYLTLMEEIGQLPTDIPAMLEHLKTEEEYEQAAATAVYYAQTAGMKQEGMCWRGI